MVPGGKRGLITEKQTVLAHLFFFLIVLLFFKLFARKHKLEQEKVLQCEGQKLNSCTEL